tara:strand:- start:612 stop:1316 length:705 start_codon:yes stop_codon:yes gene_type:complete
MINYEKWSNTLPTAVKKDNENKNFNSDPNKWINTIPKKNTKMSLGKFSITLVFFIIGLALVSVIKNKTRNLQKEINNLQASINQIETDLYNATIDHEVLTSPENISLLAEKHLETKLIHYEKSQIKQFSDKSQDLDLNEIKKESKSQKKLKTLVTKKIEEKKIELEKLKQIYNKPKEIPGEAKILLTKKIEKKKLELKQLYNNPAEVITVKKLQQWGTVQLVKAFLGIPIIPGK